MVLKFIILEICIILVPLTTWGTGPYCEAPFLIDVEAHSPSRKAGRITTKIFVTSKTGCSDLHATVTMLDKLTDVEVVRIGSVEVGDTAATFELRCNVPAHDTSGLYVLIQCEKWAWGLTICWLADSSGVRRFFQHPRYEVRAPQKIIRYSEPPRDSVCDYMADLRDSSDAVYARALATDVTPTDSTGFFRLRAPYRSIVDMAVFGIPLAPFPHLPTRQRHRTSEGVRTFYQHPKNEVRVPPRLIIEPQEPIMGPEENAEEVEPAELETEAGFTLPKAGYWADPSLLRDTNLVWVTDDSLGPVAYHKNDTAAINRHVTRIAQLRRKQALEKTPLTQLDGQSILIDGEVWMRRRGERLFHKQLPISEGYVDSLRRANADPNRIYDCIADLRDSTHAAAVRRIVTDISKTDSVGYYHIKGTKAQIGEIEKYNVPMAPYPNFPAKWGNWFR